MTQASYLTDKIISTQIKSLIETLTRKNTEEEDECLLNQRKNLLNATNSVALFLYFLSLLLCRFSPFSFAVKFFIGFLFTAGLKLSLCVLECQVLDIVPPSMQIEYFPRPDFSLFGGFLSETDGSQKNCRLFGSVVTVTRA